MNYTFSRIEKNKMGGNFDKDAIRVRNHGVTIGGEAGQALSMSEANNKVGIEVDEHNQAIRIFHDPENGFAFAKNTYSWRMGMLRAPKRLGLPIGDYAADAENAGVYILAK